MIDQNYLKEKELSNRIWKDQLKNDPRVKAFKEFLVSEIKKSFP